MNSKTIFIYSGPDSLQRIQVLFFASFLAVFMFIEFDFAKNTSFAILMVLGIASLVFGLRNDILVTEKEVVLRKKWFVIPYWFYRASKIDDVWYGGDYGLKDGADCVVIKLNGKEISFGAKKDMEYLVRGLYPLSSKREYLDDLFKNVKRPFIK